MMSGQYDTGGGGAASSLGTLGAADGLGAVTFGIGGGGGNVGAGGEGGILGNGGKPPAAVGFDAGWAAAATSPPASALEREMICV